MKILKKKYKDNFFFKTYNKKNISHIFIYINRVLNY